MTNIYIVRHGQDQDNTNGILNGHRDTPLTEIGISQAEQLAKKIKKSGIVFDKIYSSPLQRAYQTAEIVATYIHMKKPEIVDILIERDFGMMSGKNIKDIEKLCSPDIIKTDTIMYFLSPEGAETFPQLIKRANQALEYIQKQRIKGNILLVTHGDFGKMLYTAYYNLDWKLIQKSPHGLFFEIIYISNFYFLTLFFFLSESVRKTFLNLMFLGVISTYSSVLI
ncbi:MAG TPA: histidine phosphatase family protein [Candidatus Absconditabacterales bacterium]|nr:histidine phosphatase family protein [Candidatus Absconditabacterales bacterium]